MINLRLWDTSPRAPLTAYLLDRFAVVVSPYTMRRRIASGRDGMSV
jgi:hypothetical protein